MTRSPRFPLVAALLVAAAALLAGTAEATEGGVSHFPFGAQTTYAGFMPAPGDTVFYGYTAFYRADSVRDNSGNAVPGVSLDFGGFAPRIVHTWAETAGRFRFSSGVLAEVLYLDLTVPGAQDRATGIGLFGIEPAYITGSFGNWHISTGPILYFPTGSYEKTQLANSNLGYGAGVYLFNVTWTPSPRWDISLNTAAIYNLENKHTHYQSGVVTNATWGVGYQLFKENPKWSLGFTGYHVKQTSDDRLDGEPVANGNRLEKHAIGPKLAYWLTPAVAVILQWHHEFEVNNGPQGDLFWVEWGFPL